MRDVARGTWGQLVGTLFLAAMATGWSYPRHHPYVFGGIWLVALLAVSGIVAGAHRRRERLVRALEARIPPAEGVQPWGRSLGDR